MGEDHFETIPAWVQRVAMTASENNRESALDELLASLRTELGSRYPGTRFTTYRHQENLFVEWRGEPMATFVADSLGLDTYTHQSGLRIGALFFSDDLPEPLDFAYVLFRQLP